MRKEMEEEEASPWLLVALLRPNWVVDKRLEAKQDRGQEASLGGFQGFLGRPIGGLWDGF